MFVALYDWFRDHLKCTICGSVPRERALMAVIAQSFPNYRELRIHESSPGGRGTSVKLKQQCKEYSFSHFFPNVPPGQISPESGARCENLERMTFPEGSFDLFVTQDVLEHIFDPVLAFEEIKRVLRPGGAHIFTVPLVNKWRPSADRAVRTSSGEIQFLSPPQYHGNPVDRNGSLVTRDWGYDIAGVILEHTGMSSVIMAIDDLHLGLRAEYLEVVVSRKNG